HLVEEAGTLGPGGERGQKVLEVSDVQDVVGQLDPAAGMTLAEAGELLHRAPAGLAAERHRLTVEPAERAVHLLAPPAPSRRLEEDARSPAPAEAARSELREVVAVVRVGKRVEVAYHRSGAETAARELRLYAVAGPDAGEAANRPPVEYAARQL